VWQLSDHEKAMRYANLTLEGVGVPGNDIVQHGDVALHVRRKCNEREIASVMKTPRWRETRLNP